MHVSARVHFLVRVPPPLLFVLSFLAGIGLQRLVPLTVHSVGVIHVSRDVGIGLLGCGVLLAISCLGIFLALRTTVIPHGTASTLVIWGPYRLTRNPMYVGLTLAYLGLAGILAQIWPLLLLPLPVTFVHRLVIPFEEARLREKFGDAFDQYCTKVRRWV